MDPATLRLFLLSSIATSAIQRSVFSPSRLDSSLIFWKCPFQLPGFQADGPRVTARHNQGKLKDLKVRKCSVLQILHR